MPKRLLIIEDDDAMARLLGHNLVFEGFEVVRSATHADARAVLQTFAPELVLLDLMLPDGDGFDLCRLLATRRDRPPIIILSARGAKSDTIRGLNLGADDYLSKPFEFDELLARMRAVLRRHDSKETCLRLGDVVIDFYARRATRGETDIGLSRREIELLEYLAHHQGPFATRDELLHEVWGFDLAPLTRSVDIAIARLRRKIEADPHHPQFLRTVHGDGYSLSTGAT